MQPIKAVLYVTILLMFFSNCTNNNSSSRGQAADNKNKLFDTTFNWSIVMPEGFTKMSEADLSGLKNEGRAFTKDAGFKTDAGKKTIFAFEDGPDNIFEASYQVENDDMVGIHPLSQKTQDLFLYLALKNKVPNAVIDTATSIEKVSNLEFRKSTTSIIFPDGLHYFTYRYSRLFDHKLFTLTIGYSDEEKGRAILGAWQKSTFKYITVRL